MHKVYIINAHQNYESSPGRLNATLTQYAKDILSKNGHEVKCVDMSAKHDTDVELNNHRWADIVIVQSPVNWMGMPWSFKKYMDEIYTAGMDGRLAWHDGRSREAPADNYGGGGTMTGKKYMFSLTFNAPVEAFNDEKQYLFQGKGVEDLLFPVHMIYRFFDMRPLPTFACFDVVKNANIEEVIRSYGAHLQANII